MKTKPDHIARSLSESDVMDVQEVADYLGLHPKTVCAYIREGKIRAIRLGRYYRIRRQWLFDFLEGR